MGFVAPIAGALGGAAGGAGLASTVGGIASVAQGVGGIAGAFGGGGGGGDGYIPGVEAAKVLDAIPDELIEDAAGKKAKVAAFTPVGYDPVVIDLVAEQNADGVMRLMPELFALAEGNTDSKVKQLEDTRERLSPGSAKLDKDLRETISSALDNGGITDATSRLLRRNFAEANKAAGRAGGLATTASALGMRDYSTAAIQNFTRLGQQQTQADRAFAAGFVTDPLKDAGAFILPSVGQAIEAGFRNTENQQSTDAYNAQGRTAQAQEQFNIDAAPDPVAQLQLQIEMAKAGAIAGTTLGASPYTGEGGFGSRVGQVGAGIQQVTGGLSTLGVGGRGFSNFGQSLGAGLRALGSAF